MSDTERLAIAIKALKDIANIKKADCAKYVAVADRLAIDALVKLEA